MYPKGVKVLITGGAGFLGSHLAEHLISLGNEVYIVDDLSSGDLRNLSKVWNQITFEKADLTKWKTWQKIERKWKGITHVFHLAAIVQGRKNIEENPLSISHNFFIDRNAIQFILEQSIKQFVYISSSSVYPVELQKNTSNKKLKEEIIENHPKNPDMIYGWVKLIGELQLHTLPNSIDFRIVRPFSGYGPRQSSYYPVSRIMLRAINKENPIIIWGDGEQIRDFIYVDDLIRGILLISSKGQPRKAYNLCSGNGINIKTLTSKIIHTVEEMEGRENESRIACELFNPVGVFCRIGDPTRAKHELGWAPKISLTEGLRKTYIYLTQNVKKEV
jgi:nucleoside-diphosphate-sugar epimerase